MTRLNRWLIFRQQHLGLAVSLFCCGVATRRYSIILFSRICWENFIDTFPLLLVADPVEQLEGKMG